jgi:hypothetical protein
MRAKARDVTLMAAMENKKVAIPGVRLRRLEARAWQAANDVRESAANPSEEYVLRLRHAMAAVGALAVERHRSERRRIPRVASFQFAQLQRKTRGLAESSRMLIERAKKLVAACAEIVAQRQDSAPARRG